jgi:hypothetical protein
MVDSSSTENVAAPHGPTNSICWDDGWDEDEDPEVPPAQNILKNSPENSSRWADIFVDE